MPMGINADRVDYLKEKPLHVLFEEQVEKTPGNIAARFGNQFLTYKELNAKANIVAGFLKKKGVTDNVIVGISAERSLNLVIGIFGILKAGGAYLPIAADCPEARVRYMVEDSGIEIVLTGEAIKNPAAELCEWLSIEEILAQNCGNGENLDLAYDPDRLIYVIYTSGSTGKPKGVMIKSHAFVNLMNWYIQEAAIHEKDVILLIAPVSFDLAQKNIFGALITGGQLVLHPPGGYNPRIVADAIENYGVTLINCTPSTFYPLVDSAVNTDFKKLKTLRNVILGGEPIYLDRLADWAQSPGFNAEILNTYGPTECTDIVSFYRVTSKDLADLRQVPIGKPIHNVRLFIADENMNILPAGIKGELCIGGCGLAKGYLNNPELTRQRFVRLPLIPETVIYKTGDIARWREDGDIEYLGRIDNQVKIRGNRVEAEEIEIYLRKHPSVKEAVVVVKEGKENIRYLCAYFVSDEEVAAQELRVFLLGLLPEYMVPSYFTRLDCLPYTSNGKIDRNGLSRSDFSTAPQYPAGIKQDGDLQADAVTLKVIAIIKDNIDIAVSAEQMDTNIDLTALGIDSVMFITIVVAIEAELQLEFEDQYLDFKSFSNAKNLIDYVKRRLVDVKK